ncbi:MAG: malectin domain-containing carbohydrate-binding protein, partial [Isosphaeraceae bacterium]
MLATMLWANSAGGDWDVAANWVNSANSSDHHVPLSTDDAQINIGGITVTHDTSASDSVNSLEIVSGTTLSLSDGSLAVAAGSTISGDLTLTGGTTLSLGGAFTLGSSSQVSASNSTLDLGNSSSAWSNQGTITTTNSTVNLGGSFTLAGLGSFTPSGATVNLTGTLNNTGTTLAFTAATESWNLLGGTISGGTVTEAGGAELVFTNYGGTLAGVTFDNDLDLASVNDANATITDGLTLDGATVDLGNAAGSTYGQLDFDGTQTLGGTGTVLLGKDGSNGVYENAYPSGTLTLGSGITVRGSSGTIGGYYSGNAVVNQGTISADDSGGQAPPFVYDTDFSDSYTGSTAAAISTSGVTDPAPQAVYQTYRYYYYGFLYTLTGLTPSASYTLRLHFADPSSTAAGQREFNVSVNGTQVLTNFDIFAAAGGQDQAVVESLAVTADAEGQLAISFSNGAAGYPLVNGIELDSGGSIVQAINCGEIAGGTLTIGAAPFTNQGSLQVQNGETLAISGLTDNLGNATLSGSGSSLSLSGTDYVVNQGLTAGTGQALTLDGTWSNAAGSTIAATGATLNLGDSAGNAWSNQGTISATNSTVNLGGSFSVAGLGSFTPFGGTVNLTGTLNNTGTTLALTAATGSWNLLGGTISGGTVSEAGGAELTFTTSGGTLAAVTFDNNLDLTSVNDANATITDGLTLDGATVDLGNAAGTTYGELDFSGTQTLGGTGTVLFGKDGSNTVYETAYPSGTLTLGSGITVRGSSGTIGGYYTSDAVVNQGTIAADDSGGLTPPFVYDTDFSGGSTGSTAAVIGTGGVTDSAPEAVYQTYRAGSSSYTLTGLTASASYTLRLHFADPTSTAAGQRQFDVSVNGTTALTNFDIFAAAGGADQAVVESLAVTASAQGQLTISFAYGAAGAPLVNGIELD